MAEGPAKPAPACSYSVVRRDPEAELSFRPPTTCSVPNGSCVEQVARMVHPCPHPAAGVLIALCPDGEVSETLACAAHARLAGRYLYAFALLADTSLAVSPPAAGG